MPKNSPYRHSPMPPLAPDDSTIIVTPTSVEMQPSPSGSGSQMQANGDAGSRSYPARSSGYSNNLPSPDNYQAPAKPHGGSMFRK